MGRELTKEGVVTGFPRRIGRVGFGLFDELMELALAEHPEIERRVRRLLSRGRVVPFPRRERPALPRRRTG